MEGGGVALPSLGFCRAVARPAWAGRTDPTPPSSQSFLHPVLHPRAIGSAELRFSVPPSTAAFAIQPASHLLPASITPTAGIAKLQLGKENKIRVLQHC